jgi:hypothetical protein
MEQKCGSSMNMTLPDWKTSMPQESTMHLLANNDIKPGTILQMQNIPSRKDYQMQNRRCLWHTLIKPQNDNFKVALTETPEGKSKRGCTKISWNRSTEAEHTQLGWKT